MQETIEVQDELLTNTPRGHPHPKDMPWEFSLFVQQITRSRNNRLRRTMWIETLTGKMKSEVTKKLRQFVKGKKIVGEKSFRNWRKRYMRKKK